MARKKRMRWSDELLEKMAQYKAQSGQSNIEVAKHFGVSPKLYQSALVRHSKSGKTRPKAAPTYVDLVAPVGNDRVAVVFCLPDQLKSVIEAMR